MTHDLQAAKRQAWRERLRRFERSGLTAAEFCRREGIPAVSFYEWRRKLFGRPTMQRAPSRPASRPSFLPVEVISRGSSGSPVEIHFPNGVRVNLTTTDRKLAAAAITAAARVRVGMEDGAC